MKKLLLVIAIVLGLATRTFAAAELPKAAVWVEPATANVGDAVTLNALVYNNQTSDATVTVAFSETAGTIATTTATISAGTAKTVSASWKMPAQSTEVTATVTSAVTATKKSLPGLIGKIGTVTVTGTVVTPNAVSGIIPGSKQINAFFAPIITKIELFRLQEVTYFKNLKATSQASVDQAAKKAAVLDPAPDDKNTASEAAGNPFAYIPLAYATVALALFANQAIFYIVMTLALLLVLRFIVNLIV